MREQSARRSSMIAIGLSIVFWILMVGLAESDFGALAGFVLAFGLAMFAGPVVVLGPIALLLCVALVPTYIMAAARKISGFWPLFAVHIVGFYVFASKSVEALDKAWP